MKITVVTPSIRKEGLPVVAQALSNQEFKDFEWLVGSPFTPNLDVDNIPLFKWVEDKFGGGFWSLNRIYNKMFKKARGELVVTLQDWIWIPPDGLQKFVDAMESINNEGIVSGVGDKYEKPGPYGKPEIKIWNDPRKTIEHGTFYQCYAHDAEWNWCVFPKKYIFDIGGMDEKLDFLGYGGDQLQVDERWDAMGYKTYLDQANECFAIDHTRSDFGGQEEWDKKHVFLNGIYNARKEELMRSGRWPVLKFL